MRILIQFLILLTAVTFATAAPTAPRPPIQVLDEMVTRLRTIESAMQKESQKPSDHWQEDLNKLIEPIVQSVNELSRSGPHSGIPSSAYGLRVLCNGLRSSRDPKQAVQSVQQLIQTVSFLRSEHQLAAQKPAQSPATAVSRIQARDVVLEILKRSEFHQATKPHFFDYYINRIIVKVIAWFRGIFDSSAMRHAGNFAFLFLWLVYLVVGFVIIWLIHRTWTPRRKVGESAVHGENAGIVLLTPETHRAEAEALCKQGNHAAAVREYFLMMLATLEQRNFVARNRSWTNWEYLRAFGKRVRDDSARAQMGRLNLVYDQVRYGGAACDEHRFASFRKSVDDFLVELPPTPS